MAKGTRPALPPESVDAERVLRGIAVARTDDAPRAALVDARTGTLLALAEADADRWQPRVVMRKVG